MRGAGSATQPLARAAAVPASAGLRAAAAALAGRRAAKARPAPLRALRLSACAPLVAAGALAACATAPRKPADAASLLRAAQEDLAAGRAGEAQRGFEDVLAREPHDLAAIRGRIEAARKRRTLEPLAREAEAAARSRPGDAFAFYALGLSRFAQGDGPAAIVALQRAAALRPDEADIQYRLGVALLESGKPGEARAPLSEAVRLEPKTARFRMPLAGCLAGLGDRRAAVDALRDLPSLQPTAEEAALGVKVSRSLADPFRDLPQAARAEFEQALGYLARDAPGLAVPPLESLLARLPDLAPAHALLGLAEARLDEAGRAVAELKRAAELGPDLPQPHAWLAELYAAKDRPALAAAEYEESLRRDPLDPVTLRKLGVVWLEHGGGQAVEPLARAAALSPGDDELQLQLARAEQAAGSADSARERLERLAQRRPDDAEVLLRLALSLFDLRAHAPEGRRGELGRRVEDLVDRVLSLQPGNAAATRLRAALQAG